MKSPYTKKNNSRFSWAFLVSSPLTVELLNPIAMLWNWNTPESSRIFGRRWAAVETKKSNVRVATKEAPQTKHPTRSHEKEINHPNSPEICTMCLSIRCGKCLLSLKSKRNPCHGRVMPDSVTVTSVVPVRYLCHRNRMNPACEAV